MAPADQAHSTQSQVVDLLGPAVVVAAAAVLPVQQDQVLGAVQEKAVCMAAAGADPEPVELLEPLSLTVLAASAPKAQLSLRTPLKQIINVSLLPPAPLLQFLLAFQDLIQLKTFG